MVHFPGICRRTKLISICIAAAFIVLSLSGAAMASDAALGVGETGKTEELEITITSVLKAADWINSPKEGYEYVVVSIHAKNISSEEKGIGAGDFQFMNEEIGHNECYARSTGVKAAPKTFGAEYMDPGESFEGSIVFAMPKSMDRVKLNYMEGYNPKPLLVFEFDK